MAEIPDRPDDAATGGGRPALTGRKRSATDAADGPAAVGRAPDLPDDPALPGLGWLRETGIPLFFPPPHKLTKHRPGRRMILRAGSDPPVWLKLYHNDRGERVVERHHVLTEMCASGGLPFRVPPVIGYWREARLLALGDLSGTPIGLLAQPNPDSAGNDPLGPAVVAAARALRALHASRFDPGRSWGIGDEVALVTRSVQTLCMSARRSAKRVHRLGQAVGSCLTSAPLFRPAPLHRDFHPAQVLWNENEPIGILDWDDAATGPHFLDTGNFAAHLRLEAYRHPEDAPRWREAERVFLRSYLRTELPADSPASIRPFLAASLFRLAAIALERRHDSAEAEWLIDEVRGELLAEDLADIPG